MAKEGKRLTVRTELKITFEDKLDVDSTQFETIHEVLSGLNFGKLFLVAEPSQKE